MALLSLKTRDQNHFEEFLNGGVRLAIGRGQGKWILGHTRILWAATALSAWEWGGERTGQPRPGGAALRQTGVTEGVGVGLEGGWSPIRRGCRKALPIGSAGCQKHRSVPRAEVSPSGQRKRLPGSPDLFSIAGCTADYGLARCAWAGLPRVCMGSRGPRLVLGARPGDPFGRALAAV